MTDEGNVLAVDVSPGLGPVQEQGLFPDIRNDHRLALLNDLARDPFPDLVLTPGYFLLGETVRRLDTQLACVFVQKGDGPPFHLQMIG